MLEQQLALKYELIKLAPYLVSYYLSFKKFKVETIYIWKKQWIIICWMRNYQTAGILPESRRRTRNTSMFTLINCGGKKRLCHIWFSIMNTLKAIINIEHFVRMTLVKKWLERTVHQKCFPSLSLSLNIHRERDRQTDNIRQELATLLELPNTHSCSSLCVLFSLRLLL